MAFELKVDESVAEGIRRIVAEQIDKAIGEIVDADLDRHKTVHQVRKRCKKIRGAIRLVRPQMEETYRRENARFRDAARTLSALRDREAMIETYDKLLDSYAEEVSRRGFAPIRRELVRRRREAVDDDKLDRRLARFRSQLEAARQALEEWPIHREGFKGIAPGLAKTYGRGRRAMKRAYGKERTSAGFHEWRKRVKYHRYHSRLLGKLYPPLMGPWRDEFHTLSDLLGDDHDLAVLRAVLAEAPDAFDKRETVQALVGLIDRQRARLQQDARHLGTRLYAEPPRQLNRRLKAYWQAWHRQERAAKRPAEPVVPPGL